MNIKDQTLRLWIRKGKVQYFFRVGSEWRITKEDMEQFVKNRSMTLMSEDEAAKYLNITVEEIRKLCDKRLMPFIFRKGIVTFSTSDINEWLRDLVPPLLKDD